MISDDAIWRIGLDSWIIQDGNYGDFHRGELTRFAIEFDVLDLSLAVESAKSSRRIADGVYEIVGETVFLSDDAWVLDFGLSAYQERKPPARLEVGEYVCATVWLGVDPFFYFENLYKLPGMPPLIYSWRIQKILMQTAPLVESERKNLFVRDESKWGWKEIDATDAWHDDAISASYLLECERCETPAVSSIQPRAWWKLW